jgi:hypothetical protein
MPGGLRREWTVREEIEQFLVEQAAGRDAGGQGARRWCADQVLP